MICCIHACLDIVVMHIFQNDVVVLILNVAFMHTSDAAFIHTYIYIHIYIYILDAVFMHI